MKNRLVNCSISLGTRGDPMSCRCSSSMLLSRRLKLESLRLLKPKTSMRRKSRNPVARQAPILKIVMLTSKQKFTCKKMKTTASWVITKTRLRSLSSQQGTIKTILWWTAISTKMKVKSNLVHQLHSLNQEAMPLLTLSLGPTHLKANL